MYFESIGHANIYLQGIGSSTNVRANMTLQFFKAAIAQLIDHYFYSKQINRLELKKFSKKFCARYESTITKVYSYTKNCFIH